MLGIEVAESTVGRYMVRRRRPPSQGWKTFLRNHVAGIASLDLFVVRTISFRLLYGLVILRHARRRLVTIAVTANPTDQWIAGQVTDAFPWDEAPRHLIRDRDGAFGPAYMYAARPRTMRIDHPTAPRSPAAVVTASVFIGSMRRELSNCKARHISATSGPLLPARIASSWTLFRGSSNALESDRGADARWIQINSTEEVERSRGLIAREEEKNRRRVRRRGVAGSTRAQMPQMPRTDSFERLMAGGSPSYCVDCQSELNRDRPWLGAHGGTIEPTTVIGAH
jgi:hypothetical protein